MASVEQPCYTLINFSTDTEPCNEMQLKHDLEKGDIKKKIEALKKTIGMILAGEKIPGLLMIIIRFVLPLQDHTIKKLLLIFWEIVPKTSADGKLLQEMILVCDAYRKDLQHPNEYIRGSTLRFLCKLPQPTLLEPLLPAIRACLEHRHSYVRRNAVLAVATIYRNFEFLIPDAPELVAGLLDSEQDLSCKRNAFLMLLHADQARALAYLADRLDAVLGFGDILQLVIVELIYKVCVSSPGERGRFIRCVYGLLGAASPAVRYEAAGTLATLSTQPAAIKAAAQCYIDLIAKESDNNVKLIVLERLSALRLAPGAERALPELAMDLLRVLACSDLDVRKRTLDLALELVRKGDAAALTATLRKEAARAHGAEHDGAQRYRHLLVAALHRAAMQFPETAGSVAPALLELVGDGAEPAAGDVMLFVREALHSFPHLADEIYEKLCEVAAGVSAGPAARSALWLLAEFADTPHRVALAQAVLARCIPLKEEEEAAAEPEPDRAAPKQLVTSDGTYASQSAFNVASGEAAPAAAAGGLHRALFAGESYTAACACAALGRLARRGAGLPALRLAAALVARHRALHKTDTKARLSADDVEHCALWARAGAAAPAPLAAELRARSRGALARLLQDRREQRLALRAAEQPPAPAVQLETAVQFAQLAGAAAPEADALAVSLSAAVGGRSSADAGRLSRVRQLTGLSDPVYAECALAVNQYDIVLDILLVNQTDDTLQSCSVELATLGELRLVERPAAAVLAPRDFAVISAHVKVNSTENGVIFGNIVYEVSGASMDRGTVVLNDIHIDIVDYIQPADCSEQRFRQMWAEFEWENKVSVNTNVTGLREYLAHLLAATNMRCLTPEKALSGQCGFLAANMYARSIFGEDALANLSLELPLQGSGPVQGHVRIRAKTQGMALSLGDKINLMQKSAQQKPPPPAIAAA